jgi:hypothetical protein
LKRKYRLLTWCRRVRQTGCLAETELGWVVDRMASLGEEVEGVCGLVGDGEVAEGGRVQNRRRSG